MTARHLISDGDLSLLCDIAANKLVDSGRELITVFSCKYLNINDNARFAVRDLQRVISYFPCLFAENSTEQSFLSCQLGLSLRSYLTNEDIA